MKSRREKHNGKEKDFSLPGKGNCQRKIFRQTKKGMKRGVKVEINLTGCFGKRRGAEGKSKFVTSNTHRGDVGKK